MGIKLSIRPFNLPLITGAFKKSRRFMVDEAVGGRYCCKSRFTLLVENSAGRQCDFHVKMWGASSPHVKLTGDLANVSEAIRIGDCFPFRNFAKNQSPCNFRLLQQYRTKADDSSSGLNGHAAD